MEFKFQKFTDTNKRFDDRITVTRNRAIGFPTHFYKNNGVREFKYGVLYFDRENNAIGVKFTNNEDEAGKIRLIHSKNDYGGHLLANSFFKAHRINTKRFSGRYEYARKALNQLGLNEDGTLFIIKLAEHDEKPKIKKEEAYDNPIQ